MTVLVRLNCLLRLMSYQSQCWVVAWVWLSPRLRLRLSGLLSGLGADLPESFVKVDALSRTTALELMLVSWSSARQRPERPRRLAHPH